MPSAAKARSQVIFAPGRAFGIATRADAAAEAVGIHRMLNAAMSLTRLYACLRRLVRGLRENLFVATQLSFKLGHLARCSGAGRL